jgi:PAT family acetyl-CoA transporter-like MFS transporter 1
LNSDGGEEDLGIGGTYKMLYKIVFLPLMPATIIFLLTSKIGFSAADSVTGLKLIEAGVPKDKLAMLAVPMIPLQIMLPWVISKYTTGPKPMDVFLKAFPLRLLMGLVFTAVVFVTPQFMQEDGSFPIYYYGLVLFVYALHQVHDCKNVHAQQLTLVNKSARETT